MLIRDHNFYMQKALNLAFKAKENDEVPIGAIVVYEDTIIAQAHNQVETLKDATAHAEILAITQASTKIKDWRLNSCSIYITKEPCLMCFGAIINSRIKNIFYALEDKQFGAFAKVDLKKQITKYKLNIQGGILRQEALQLIQEFFKQKRTHGKISQKN